MKLCTVIAYYKTSITKQFKFLNSHCFIVCVYCSHLCLMAKSELKMIKFSSSFKLNKIHTIDRPFEIRNRTFSREALILEGTAGKFWGMSNNRDIYCYANRRVVNFERAYQPLRPGSKILVMPQFSCVPDQILGKRAKI